MNSNSHLANITPIKGKVIIEREPDAEFIGRIMVPASSRERATARKYGIGTVRAVGTPRPDVPRDGAASDIQAGDRVAFEANYPASQANDKVVVVTRDSVMAILDPR